MEARVSEDQVRAINDVALRRGRDTHRRVLRILNVHRPLDAAVVGVVERRFRQRRLLEDVGGREDDALDSYLTHGLESRPSHHVFNRKLSNMIAAKAKGTTRARQSVANIVRDVVNPRLRRWPVWRPHHKELHGVV